MITNYATPPHDSLSFFIAGYFLSTSAESSISFNRPVIATNETSLVFFLSDKPTYGWPPSVASLTDSPICLIGLQTRCNGMLQFTGVYRAFIIHFRASGYHKIFGLSAADTIDRFFPGAALLGTGVWQLYEKLRQARNLREMAVSADAFLLETLKRHDRKNIGVDGICRVSLMMYDTASPLAISAYARMAYMSMRNFERNFTSQVGISPKLYCRLMRFSEAMKRKNTQPARTWTSIAHDCHYFDQMHFIRECRQFSGLCPGELVRQRLVTAALV